MAVIPLLRPSAEARALLHHILQHGDLVGRDPVGRTIIQLVVDDWTLQKLMAFDADAAELEDEGNGEPDDGPEEDGIAVPLDLKRARVVRRRLDTSSSAGQRAGTERTKNKRSHGSPIVPFPARVLDRVRPVAEP